MYRERDAGGRFQKGVSATLEERKDIAARFKGSRSWLWKGGVTAPNQLLRTQVDYQIWRLAVFKRDDYTCQRCHKK